MIVAQQKPLEEIKALIGEARRVLVVGCGTCVTVCFAGGAREAAILSASLRIASKLRSEEHTSELQSQSNIVCRLLLAKKTWTPPPWRRACAPAGPAAAHAAARRR